MNNIILVQDMFNRNHSESWWSLTKEQQNDYYNKNINRVLMAQYKKTGVARLQVIFKKDKDDNATKSNVVTFEKYLRNNGFKFIMFPYSKDSIFEITYNVEFPYSYYKGFLEDLKHFGAIKTNKI